MADDQLPWHNRRSVRLPGYDYASPGAYFVTICTHEGACLFGEITGGVMHLNEYGSIVREEWWQTAVIRPNVELQADEFVVMPNHLHGVIRIMGPAPPTTERFGKPVSGSIPTIVRAFKSVTARRINESRDVSHASVWQANYFEHVIRGEEQMHRIRRYIAENPARWAEDEDNPFRKR